ncbi:MAG: hypothetical protein ACXVXP_10240 [Mycobacteriaceae bacterium]
MVTRGDDVIGVCAIAATAAGIDGVFTILNPDKLGQLRAKPPAAG